MASFAETELTRDAFLGGRVHLWQPKHGYRAGVDPVLLAASVPARAGETVLELGCGAGAASICLAVRVPGLSLAGVERQAAYAELARRNAAENGTHLAVHCADLREMPVDLTQARFDHVIANPPFYSLGRHASPRDPGRAGGRIEDTPLTDWIAVAARRLKPRGLLHLIQHPERLPELLAAASGRLGSMEVLPLAPREARAPSLLLFRARKEGRAAFRLHAPLILHAGASHDRDGESYRPEILAILRKGEALDWPSASSR